MSSGPSLGEAKPPVTISFTTSTPYLISRRAAERAAALYTPIKTAKLDGQSPEAYQRDVLTRFAAHPNKCLVGFLPWNWSPALAAARPT